MERKDLIKAIDEEMISIQNQKPDNDYTRGVRKGMITILIWVKATMGK